MIIFETTFEASFIFWGSWGCIKNWLELKIKQLLETHCRIDPLLRMKRRYLVHFIDDEVRDLQVSVDDPVHLEVVVVLAERVDQGFGNLQKFLLCVPKNYGFILFFIYIECILMWSLVNVISVIIMWSHFIDI